MRHLRSSGASEEEVLLLLQEMRNKDFRYDRFLSTMCTQPHKIAVQAHDMFIETNLGDAGLFPGTALIEFEVIRMMGELLGCPSASGYISTGGTESNIQAIRASRNLARAVGRVVKGGNIVVPHSAHFSFDKIGDLLNLEVRKALLDEDLKVDLDHVRSLCDESTVSIVGIAGTTEFGQVDPIPGLSEIASDFGAQLHVDAAFGGFVLPFMKNKIEWDFRVPMVSSITIDPHKMGMSTIPAGGLLFRSHDDLAALATDTHYLTVAKQASLTGTRSGAAAAATYAVMMLLGTEGFEKLVTDCMNETAFLVKEAKAIGVMPVIEPVMNVVALQVEDAADVREALMKRGWHVSITREPKALRIIVMPHMTRENLRMFVNDLDEIVNRSK